MGNKGKENGFDGDLSGDSFPVLQSQVNKLKPIDDTPSCEITENRQLNDVNTDGNSNEDCVTENACGANKDISHAETNVNNSTTLSEIRKEATSTLADMLKTNSHDNKLLVVPTEVNENGVEIAIFVEEIVELGSAKWEKTVCGQFLGCMDMTVNDKGIFFFKFQDEQGILQAISNGPWMLLNVPLEAWSVKGISSLASCLGKPLIIDEVTTNVCKTGMGRLSFARVLIELDAEKQFKHVIEIAYRKKDASTSMTKYVQVEYTWKPTRCSYCCVFGHDDVNCRLIPRETESVKTNGVQGEVNDGFQKVTYKNDKNENYNNRRFEKNGLNVYTKGPNRMNGYKQNKNKQNYRPKQNVEVTNQFGNVNSSGVNQNAGNSGNNAKENGSSSKNGEDEKEVLQGKTPMDKSNDNNSSGGQKQSNVGIIGDNRYVVLESLVEEENLQPSIEDRKLVDSVLETNVDPTVTEWDRWNDGMKVYYKGKKELIDAVNKVLNEEDVVHDLSSNGDSMLRNEIEGISCNTLN
ncbi:ATPase, F1/V1/A1 complex, alpha/beta subunit, Zinc knuckle CX2CX4HX4C [Artemisia annua]|uniref:ATPase, F1/V1/A1 complex, alpha/beta subunit, Zinc knuckle CX2CX4HX4C n=1 Tax=Artemisia annua TaxID=35608 RepID=A0A2U1MZ86_ARTAN|nr:ATPase, F1/V1/A1 complex, alpha/beta subunit, Zinc knuckle CX2CX4HX4C [Artemisia annua]